MMILPNTVGKKNQKNHHDSYYHRHSNPPFFFFTGNFFAPTQKTRLSEIWPFIGEKKTRKLKQQKKKGSKKEKKKKKHTKGILKTNLNA